MNTSIQPAKGEAKFKKIELNEQAEELGDIIEKLAVMAVSMREAFDHQ